MGKTHIEGAPDKVVIIAGPTFGQALKFMVFGAALGAGAVYYLLNDSKEAASNAAGSEATEKFEAAAQNTTSDLADRLSTLASRLKKVGLRAKSAVESATEAIKPTLEQAVAEGKKTAAEVQAKLKHDVDEAGDGPAIAEQDGELPSEQESKFVE